MVDPQIAPAATPQPASGVLAIDVVELNEHTPRPFVFTEPAICLRDSIRSMGLRSEHRVNIADPGAISIVLGAVPPLHLPLEQLDPRKTLLFNFEQLASPHAVVDAQYLRWLRDWLVLDYHSRNVDHLRRLNGPAQRVLELPIVPSPSLRFRPEIPAEKTVDVLFFGSPCERRLEVLRRLEAAGVRVETVAGAYADELTPAIRRARVVLHVHFHDTGLFPVARILQPVADGVPIVCENSVFSAHSDWSESGIVFAPYEGLLQACLDLLRSPQEQQARAERSRRFADQLDFAGPFESVLREIAAQLARPPRTAAPAAPMPAVPPQAIAPPQPIAPPRSCAARTDPEATLSTEEIETILERETVALPMEAHVPAPPLAMVQRQPGQHRFSRWVIWLIIAFTLASIIQALR